MSTTLLLLMVRPPAGITTVPAVPLSSMPPCPVAASTKVPPLYRLGAVMITYGPRSKWAVCTTRLTLSLESTAVPPFLSTITLLRTGSGVTLASRLKMNNSFVPEVIRPRALVVPQSFRLIIVMPLPIVSRSVPPVVDPFVKVRFP